MYLYLLFVLYFLHFLHLANDRKSSSNGYTKNRKNILQLQRNCFLQQTKKMVGKQLILVHLRNCSWWCIPCVCLSVFDVLIYSNSLKSDHLQWMGGCLLTITNRYTMQTEEHFSFLFWRARDHYNHYRRTNVSVQEHWSLVPFFLYIFTFWPPGTNM